MPKKYPGFTFEEHQDFGSELSRSREFFMDYVGKLQTAYGKSSKPCKIAVQVYKTIDQLRNKLDERVCAENPLHGDQEVISCYYPVSR